MGQHQCIGQPMGNMKVPAQRIGQRMHRGDWRIGKGLTGQARTEQHGLTCLAVTAVVHRLIEVAGEHVQGFAGQQVGQRVTLELAGVGFDGVDHGIDTGGSGDRWRQANGQVGIKQRQVRQQQG
ncbi:hypothetical protein D3C72_1364350 [compost metagenome]